MTNENNATYETKLPTYTVKFMRTAKGQKNYPVQIGAAFETGKGNQRLVLNMVPASFELKNGMFILVPYEQESETEV